MSDSRAQLVLASGSPRRRALLEAACFTVQVRVPHADESWPGGDIHRGVVIVAHRKLASIGPADGLALAADTVVVADGQILGKPEDADEAIGMLRHLAGRRHEVVTGYCVSSAGARREGAVQTSVWFRELSDVEIDTYVASGEPFDKAGAYAIQGRAGAFIDRIRGSYTNVVGLPITEVINATESLT